MIDLVLMRKFDKNRSGLGHYGQLYGMQMFIWKHLGSLDEIIWGFLKKGMRIEPHKHLQKEIYLFVGGRGFMQMNDRVFKVERGDAIYITPNSTHTVWNDEEKEDLEFIVLIFTYQAKDLMPLLGLKHWVRRLRDSLRKG